MVANNCATTSLSPFTQASGNWNESKVRHIYRRLGFGATRDQIDAALLMTPQDFLDQLLSSAINTPLPEAPFWANWTDDDYPDDDDGELFFDHEHELRVGWLKNCLQNPLLAKMAMFWHDHFATEKRVYDCNSSAWSYYHLLHENAFGNFRIFVEKMGLNPAMLVYLNGNENYADEPNENYARELMELFTMGEGNGYTQTDIEEVARALTGWRMNEYQCTPPYFDSSDHDHGIKTIFGQSGNFGYDDVHELIFTLRKDQIADYICTKLYQHFVYYEPNKEVVAQLAITFKDNNWNIESVVSQLLRSEHFFDENFIGGRIKNPIELICNMLSVIGLDPDLDFEEDVFDYFNYISREMGMRLFDPPNVAGWPGHHVWLSENALTNRWTFCGTLIRNYLNDTGKEKLRQLALNLSNSSNDPYVISEAMAVHFLSSPLSGELLEIANLFLRSGIPENYFNDGSWNLYWEEAPDQLLNLIGYFIQLPEFQLA